MAAEKKQRVNANTEKKVGNQLEQETQNALYAISGQMGQFSDADFGMRYSQGDRLKEIANAMLKEQYDINIRSHAYSRNPGQLRVSMFPTSPKAQSALAKFNQLKLSERLAVVRYLRSVPWQLFRSQKSMGVNQYNLNLLEQQLMADYWMAHRAVDRRLPADLTNEVMQFVGRGGDATPGMKKGFF